MGSSTVRGGGWATADGIAKRPQPVADCVVPGGGAPQIQLDSLTIPGPYKSTETEAAAPTIIVRGRSAPSAITGAACT